MDFSAKQVLVTIGLTIGGSLLAVPGYEEPWGKDIHLLQTENIYITPSVRQDPLSTTAEYWIRFHQTWLSPTTGPRSNFRPTSSRYTQLSIRKYGFIKGILKGCDRLLRENNDRWYYRTTIIDGNEYNFDPS